MDYLFVILILLILLVIYYYISSESENFDTYMNHDIGAYLVYKNEYGYVPKIFGSKKINGLKDASLVAKYVWAKKDPLGENVYDRMYEGVVREQNMVSDDDYAYRDSDINLDNVYDTKFSILDNENELSRYRVSDMKDNDSINMYVNGQLITLSQKQY